MSILKLKHKLLKLSQAIWIGDFMNRQEFIMSIDELKATYGMNKYPNSRVEIFWNKFKHVDHRDFRKVIMRLIAYEQFAPMFGKLEEELRPFLYRKQQKDQESSRNKTEYDCTSCRDSGIVHVKNEKKIEHAFRCDCKHGERHTNYPRKGQR